MIWLCNLSLAMYQGSFSVNAKDHFRQVHLLGVLSTPHRVEIRRMLGNNHFFEGKLMCLMWGHMIIWKSKPHVPSDSTDQFCINSFTPGSDLSVIVSTLVAAKDTGTGTVSRQDPDLRWSEHCVIRKILWYQRWVFDLSAVCLAYRHSRAGLERAATARRGRAASQHCKRRICERMDLFRHLSKASFNGKSQPPLAFGFCFWK